jgi:hypothetical protein
MAKTKGDIKREIKECSEGARDFDDMVDRIALYIIRNYKLKKSANVITIVQPIQEEEENGTETGDSGEYSEERSEDNFQE